jgi:hypothetical protein
MTDSTLTLAGAAERARRSGPTDPSPSGRLLNSHALAIATAAVYSSTRCQFFFSFEDR